MSVNTMNNCFDKITWISYDQGRNTTGTFVCFRARNNYFFDTNVSIFKKKPFL